MTYLLVTKTDMPIGAPVYGSLQSDFDDASDFNETLQSLSFDDTFLHAGEADEASAPMIKGRPRQESFGAARNPAMLRMGILALGILLFGIVITLVLVARAAALAETVESGLSSVFSKD